MGQELKIGDKIYKSQYSYYNPNPIVVVKVIKNFVFTDNGLKFRKLASEQGYCHQMLRVSGNHYNPSSASYWLESDKIIKQIEDNRK